MEMVQEAVRDAIKNAEENKVTPQQKIAKTVDFSFKSKVKTNITNKVTNCKFFAGKAEDILPNLLRDVDSKEVIAKQKDIIVINC